MLIYRILSAKYGSKLIGSGRAARWNSDDIEVIYNASSRSLACLEMAVHYDQARLNRQFNILTIDCPEDLEIKAISLNDLPNNWTDFDQIKITQTIGDNWVKENQTAMLQVPSSIVNEELNYLINPSHPDFRHIKLVKTQPFIFDGRIKH